MASSSLSCSLCASSLTSPVLLLLLCLSSISSTDNSYINYNKYLDSINNRASDYSSKSETPRGRSLQSLIQSNNFNFFKMKLLVYYGIISKIGSCWEDLGNASFKLFIQYRYESLQNKK